MLCLVSAVVFVIILIYGTRGAREQAAMLHRVKGEIERAYLVDVMDFYTEEGVLFAHVFDRITGVYYDIPIERKRESPFDDFVDELFKEE